MAQYFLTRKAINYLAEIWDNTCNTWSEVQAEKYYELLLDQFKNLSENPDLGKEYTHISNNLFAYIFKMHLIFYRKIDPDKIEITRILHQRMDVKSHLK